MKRLTKKDGITYFVFDRNGNWQRSLEITKLGQYEDNDEKIGINYNIITQALLKGVYYIEFGTTQIRHTNGLSLQAFDGKRFCLANKNHHFVMEDYGKSKYNPWALNKEELEKGAKQ